LKRGNIYSLAMETIRPLMPMVRAAAGVRSMTRPRTNGPLLLMVTTTDLPLLLLVLVSRAARQGSMSCRKGVLIQRSTASHFRAAFSAVLGSDSFFSISGVHESGNQPRNRNDDPQHYQLPVKETSSSAVALLGVTLRRPPVFLPVAIYFPSTCNRRNGRKIGSKQHAGWA
jgi:hypothetical protein